MINLNLLQSSLVIITVVSSERQKAITFLDRNQVNILSELYPVEMIRQQIFNLCMYMYRRPVSSVGRAPVC